MARPKRPSGWGDAGVGEQPLAVAVEGHVLAADLHLQGVPSVRFDGVGHTAAVDAVELAGFGTLEVRQVAWGTDAEDVGPAAAPFVVADQQSWTPNGTVGQPHVGGEVEGFQSLGSEEDFRVAGGGGLGQRAVADRPVAAEDLRRGGLGSGRGRRHRRHVLCRLPIAQRHALVEHLAVGSGNQYVAELNLGGPGRQSQPAWANIVGDVFERPDAIAVTDDAVAADLDLERVPVVQFDGLGFLHPRPQPGAAAGEAFQRRLAVAVVADRVDEAVGVVGPMEQQPAALRPFQHPALDGEVEVGQTDRSEQDPGTRFEAVLDEHVAGSGPVAADGFDGRRGTGEQDDGEQADGHGLSLQGRLSEP